MREAVADVQGGCQDHRRGGIRATTLVEREKQAPSSTQTAGAGHSRRLMTSTEQNWISQEKEKKTHVCAITDKMIDGL